MIPVIEVVENDRGALEAAVGPVQSSEDVEVVSSLDGYTKERCTVLVFGKPREIEVYRKGDLRYATWESVYSS